MDNFTTTVMENYAKKMDEKFADKAADKADYQEFKADFKDLVEKTFEDKGIHDVEVENRLVDKVNETYDAFTIKHTGSDVGVNISATEAYRAYATDEADIKTIANAMVNRTVEALLNAPVISEGINDIQNYEIMKNKLVMEVVSAETNAELLETVPHKDIEDMAVVYRFDVKDIVGEGATVIVTNKMLDNYGITPEQLHADAVKNAPEIRPIVIQGMAEVLAKQMGVEDMEMLGLNIPPKQEQIFVASAPDNIHGAGILAYEDFMDKASERVGNQEFIGLRWQDIDMEERTININHALVRVKRHRRDPTRRLGVSLLKTDAGIRVIPMMDQVYDCFKRIYEEQLVTGFNETVIEGMSGFIFKNANNDVLCEQNLNFAIKRIAASYNMEEGVKAAKEKRKPLLLPNFSVHYLRHTFCTRFCENESNVKVVQSVMGHKSVRTTLGVYAEATGTKNQEAMQNLSAKWKEL